MELFTKCSRCGRIVEEYKRSLFPGIACCMFDVDGRIEGRPSLSEGKELFYGSEAANDSHALCPACIHDLLKWLDCPEDVMSVDEV